MHSGDDRPQQRATCIAYGPDLRRLFLFGRRLVAAAQRPVLANRIELVVELAARLDVQVIVVDTPDQDEEAFVNRTTEALLEGVGNARLVFSRTGGDPLGGEATNLEVVYFFDRDATPPRIKAIIDMATFSDGLMGSIEKIDLLDFLQLQLMKRGTAAIAVRGGGQVGKIFVRLGDIVDARFGTLRGAEAVTEVLCMERGQFQEVPMPVQVERTIHGRGDAVLLDAMRVRDDRARDALDEEEPVLPGTKKRRDTLENLFAGLGDELGSQNER